MSTAAPPVAHPPLAPPAPVALAQAATTARCENCGAAVAEKYCGVCGQRVEPPVHSLWHFAQVAAEDLTHADSRLWRTLAALLFKPGYLTREFLDGRRARYLPPVRLYLVLSVVFFLWASTTHSGGPVLQVSVPDHGTLRAAVKPAGAQDNPLTPRPGESAEQRAQRVCNNAAYQGPWRQFMLTTMHQVCLRTVADNGRAEREAFLHNLPRALFVFLPVLAGAMMLLYWRPRHYYVEHLLLLLHNHAFIFLLLVCAGLLSALLTFASGWISAAVTLYIAWYMYRSMRVVYGQGRWLTVGKLALLSFFYLVSGSLMLAVTSLYSVITM
jgi:hypothetical protein